MFQRNDGHKVKQVRRALDIQVRQNSEGRFFIRLITGNYEYESLRTFKRMEKAIELTPCIPHKARVCMLLDEAFKATNAEILERTYRYDGNYWQQGWLRNGECERQNDWTRDAQGASVLEQVNAYIAHSATTLPNEK